jgi:predicted DNA-binding ribbon-helix-helix protein
MPRPLKRSLRIAGHRTSLSLEPQFWDLVRIAAQARNKSIAALIGEIDRTRGDTSLSSAVRIFVLNEALKGRLVR